MIRIVVEYTGDENKQKAMDMIPWIADNISGIYSIRIKQIRFPESPQRMW